MNGQPAKTSMQVLDLVDFVRRWSDFRGVAVSVAGHPALAGDERAVIEWLIALADRVGRRDVE
jgi:hypothetical protein